MGYQVTGAGDTGAEVVRVRVLLFGVLREMAGAAECEVTARAPLTAGGAIAELRQELASRCGPASDPVWNTLAVAVNEQYADRATVLQGGDIVALLPPVSGG